MTTVLVVDDLAQNVRLLEAVLVPEGYDVRAASSGEEALDVLQTESVDIVLLDVQMAGMSGYEVCRRIRARADTAFLPVVMVTSHDSEARVDAIESGADDFVTKPFGADHLEARIRAVLRRSGSPRAEGPITVGELVVDARTRTATLEGRALELSRKEFDLLLALAQRAGEVVSKRDLLAEVWRQPYGGGDRTVDVHLSWLRRKLGESAAEPRYLHSTRGVGVRLAAPAGA
jgi:DNA-binding response OmpR family regulator